MTEAEARVPAGCSELLRPSEEFLADELNPGRYHLESLASGVRHLDVSRNSFYPECLPLAENERLLQFEEELRRPKVVSEPITGSHYNVYSFNRDFQEKGPGDSAVVFFPSLSSSPTAEQGQAVIWQLCQLFPEKLIISIGNEGTFDARASDLWLEQSDSLIIAETRRQCIMEVLEDFEVPPANISLIGQSMGGAIAFNVAKHMQYQCPAPDKLAQLKVDKLIMISTPVVEGSTLPFCMEMVRQETAALLRGPWKDKVEFLRHLGRSVIPTFVCPDAVRNLQAHRKLIEAVPGSVRLEELGAGVDVSFITGGKDRRAQFADFLGISGDSTGIVESPGLLREPGRPNVSGITVKGQKHTAFLLDDRLCGQTIRLAWNWPNS